MHGSCPLYEILSFLFSRYGYCDTFKPYTRKYIVIVEPYIASLHTSYYIPEIQNIAFNIPHVRIIGTNRCGNTCRKSFKCCSEKQDVLCHCDYSERVLDSFAHQI